MTHPLHSDFKHYLTDEQLNNPTILKATSLLTLIDLKKSIENLNNALTHNPHDDLNIALNDLLSKTKNITQQMEVFLFQE